MGENAARSFRMLLAADDSEASRRRLEPDTVQVLAASVLLIGATQGSAP